VVLEWFDEKVLRPFVQAIVNDEEVAVLLMRTAVQYHRSDGYVIHGDWCSRVRMFIFCPFLQEHILMIGM
jgi:hypothetical protein